MFSSAILKIALHYGYFLKNLSSIMDFSWNSSPPLGLLLENSLLRYGYFLKKQNKKKYNDVM